MKKEIKAGLKEIYEAPPSLKKDEFLQRIGEPELTHLEFLRMQVHYIRKGNWLISVVFFLSALFALRQAELELLWPISAFVPFLALRSGYWAALLAGAAILAGREIKKLLQQSEELVWN